MNLSGLLDALRMQDTYRDLLLQVSDSQDISLGLIRAARPYLAAALAHDTGKPTLVITDRMDRAYNFAEQLLAWSSDLSVLTFAAPNPLFYERAAWGMDSIRARLQVIAELIDRPQPGTVIIASARALMQRTIPREVMLSHRMVLKTDDTLSDQIGYRWLEMGYESVSVVIEPGTFSRRGGILDIYPVAAQQPARIELWGDVIDSIRAFDPASQRSLDALQSVTITPAREALPVYGPQVAERLADWFSFTIKPGDEGAEHSALLLHDFESLRQGTSFPALEFYLPWMYSEPSSLLDYLPDDVLLLVDDLSGIAEITADLETQALDLRSTYEGSGEIPPDMPLPFVTWDHLGDGLSQIRTVQLSGVPEESHHIGDLFETGPRYGGQLKTLLEHLRYISRANGEQVIVASRQAGRLAELWYEQGMGVRLPVIEDLPALPDANTPTFVQGALTEGWVLRAGDSVTHLFTDAEVFGWKRPEPRRRPQRRAVTPEDFFADLTPGDFVVHAEYGIGRFDGLGKRTFTGVEREFLLIAYAGGDMLYVPIHQADRLTRYVGPDDSEPSLSRLGTPDWSRVKERTKQAVEEIAQELLDLYAARETTVGHAFSPDTPWQHELEASFPYVETDDQLRALEAVKQDMESARPMDRLICGDVGYGKTEVALRAAFKAVMDGKQAAMLVPTTVLAQQHYDTFSRRLSAFPVQVEMLSRFRTKSEQERIIEKVADGQIDVVIGTHRLLGRDIEFKDLGLLIIDEEQRFGVTHKERLKQMRAQVDVLTLTATPIPRTLYMSLTGIRDISTIDTAPEERLPVITHVGRRDDDLVRQAILREIDRGGQVFVVHNRVQTIHVEASRLQKIVPEATHAVAHGQMPEAQLEAVMNQFAAGEINVLVSTNIIEAGLDIPSANTLIVDRADRFGLAQLYQLRGRVGRSASQAFAYFFHPPVHRLTDEARARLETIAEETQLGAGMSIAMRDLEIRGAGDVLGARQSGHITTVGFHLYTQMLAQAVKRLRAQRDGRAADRLEEKAEDAPREIVTIDLPLPTYIPTDYVPELSLRIQLYRRLADMNSAETIDDLKGELADRFGPPPPPVQNLIYQLHVKRLALRANVEAVTTDNGQVGIRVPGLAHVDRAALQRRLGYDVRVSRTTVWMPRPDEHEDDYNWRAALLDLLERLAAERIRPSSD